MYPRPAQAQVHSEVAVKAILTFEKEAADQEAKMSKLTLGPSQREALEAEKEAFTVDVCNFEAVVKNWATKDQGEGTRGKNDGWGSVSRSTMRSW